jgi:hypothetical protein
MIDSLMAVFFPEAVVALILVCVEDRTFFDVLTDGTFK